MSLIQADIIFIVETKLKGCQDRMQHINVVGVIIKTNKKQLWFRWYWWIFVKTTMLNEWLFEDFDRSMKKAQTSNIEQLQILLCVCYYPPFPPKTLNGDMTLISISITLAPHYIG